jgi:TonB family protein
MYHLLAATLAAALGSSQVATIAAKPASCTTDHEQARLVQATPVDYPPIFKEIIVSDRAFIRVNLSDTGRVMNTAIAKSSGNSSLDRAAVAAVNSSTYAPESNACSAVAGSYAIEVDFDD